MESSWLRVLHVVQGGEAFQQLLEQLGVDSVDMVLAISECEPDASSARAWFPYLMGSQILTADGQP